MVKQATSALSCINENNNKTTDSGARASNKMGANRNNQKQPQASKAGTASRTQRSQQSKLIKKAYVRFDDYLDLNEENMRRSCKRLMNRLYSEPGDLVAPTNAPRNGQSSSSSPPPPLHLTADPCSSAGASQADSPHEIQKGPTTSEAPHSLPCGLQANEKSYLRSQYERRQKRQFELMNKTQQQQQQQNRVDQTTMDKKALGRCNHNEQAKNDGANNNCRRQQQHQQDLVAKSHELSKRRFFEKLERRESMKNLNLGTQSGQHLSLFEQIETVGESSSRGSAAAACTTTTANAAGQQAADRVNQRQLGKCPILNDNEDQLMLKVYQSIALQVNRNSSTVSSGGEKDTLGGLTGPPAQLPGIAADNSANISLAPPSCGSNSLELVNELIGFHTPLPQLQSVEVAATCKSGSNSLESTLIEFLQRERALETTEHASELCNNRKRSVSGGADEKDSEEDLVSLREADFDRSAFEIKVPASSSASNSRDQVDGSIGSSLLVVKQMEENPGNSRAEHLKLNISSGHYDEERTSSSQFGEANKTLEVLPLVISVDTSVVAATVIGTHLPAPKAASEVGAEEDEETRRHGMETISDDYSWSRVEPVSSDNQSSRVISSTISSGSDGPTASMTDGEIKTTSVPTKDVGAKKTTSELSVEEAAPAKEDTMANKTKSFMGSCSNGNASGANQVSSHEAPEMEAALVKQSRGGVGPDQIGDEFNEASLSRIRRRNSHPVSKESTAQKEQQVAGAGSFVSSVTSQSGASGPMVAAASTSLKTIITNSLAIRDVLPGANVEFDRSGTNVSALAAPMKGKCTGSNDAEKVDEGHERLPLPLQVDEAASSHGKIIKHTVVDPEEQWRQLQQKRGQPLKSSLCREQDPLNDGQQYANPSSVVASAAMSVYSSCKNNVDRELAHVNVSDELSDMIGNGGNGESGEQKHQLIEQFEEVVSSAGSKRKTLITGDTNKFEKASTQQPQHATRSEEDGGSSCSSSGFGASVGSSSSAASTDGQSDSVKVERKNFDQNGYRRPNSLSICNSSQARNCDVQIYDSVRAPRSRSGIHSRPSLMADEFPDYRQLVGPDQAYPSSRIGCSQLLVENHGYASLVNHCQSTVNPDGCTARSPVQIKDFSSGQYANLLTNGTSELGLKPTAHVEYATVRANPVSTGAQKRTALVENKENLNTTASATKFNRHNSSASSEASSSGAHSCSTHSTANSGGFSRLPPVHIIDCLSANNFQSLQADDDNSLTQQQSIAGRKSLLKRFGSLVSRAFTSAGGSAATVLSSPPEVSTDSNEPAPMQLAKEEQSPLDQMPPPGPFDQRAQRELHADCSASANGYADDDGYDSKNATRLCKTGDEGPKSALVIGRNHQVVIQDVGNTLGEADLVILPTKHQIDQRGANASLDQVKNQIDLHCTKRRAAVDKVSPSRRVSQKPRQCCNSVSFASSLSSLATSLLSLSLSVSSGLSDSPHGTRRDGYRRRRLRRRASSLSEELESLMSPSEIESQMALYYRDKGPARVSRKARTTSASKQTNGRAVVSSSKRKTALKSSSRRIDIDCVSPTQQVDDAAERQSVSVNAENKSTSSRSILRWFSSTNSSSSQAQQDPNLTAIVAVANHNSLVMQSTLAECSSAKHRESFGTNEHQLISGFWGFSSLIDHSHAKTGATTAAGADKLDAKAHSNTVVGKQKKESRTSKLSSDLESSSLIYSSLRRPTSMDCCNRCGSSNKIHDAERCGPLDHSGPKELSNDKCRSLNLYQNLMQNYVKRRNHRHHGRHHHHHYQSHNRNSNYHTHRNHSSSCHAQIECPAAPCRGPNCAASQPCLSSNGSVDHSIRLRKAGSGTTAAAAADLVTKPKTCVWGQLIKINKKGGSQVIELQRLPGKPWSFSVARGAIDNVKGEFFVHSLWALWVINRLKPLFNYFWIDHKN